LTGTAHLSSWDGSANNTYTRQPIDSQSLESNGHIYSDIAAAEIRLQKSFLEDCTPQLQLLESAMFLLGELMVSIEPSDPPLNPGEVAMPKPGDVRQLMLFTHMMIAVRGLRVIQAARPTLAAGYELEALVNNRIIVELVEHRRVIRKDETGEAARKWLDAPPGRIGPRIKKLAKGDLYEYESRAAHGDPRLLKLIFNHDRNALPLTPARSDFTRGSLVLYASFLVDQIEVLSALANVTSPQFPSLRKAVAAEWKKFKPS
jgi:hypothetical protein